MIDYNLVIKDKEFVKTQLARKCYDISKIDTLYDLLLHRKELLFKLEDMTKERNSIQKDSSISNDYKKELRNKIAEFEKDVEGVNSEVQNILYDIPNLPEIDAYNGTSANDNVVIEETEDYYKCAVENPLPHWEIGKQLDILDFDMATKISGTMFAAYKGLGSKLLRALIHYCLSLNEHRYTEITPPHLVTSKSLTFTGHLPKFAEDQYNCANDDLWLIPTAEVPLTASFANTTFKQGELPIKCMGYTVAFRREAGSHGWDTRGLQRVHEFHKVELLKVVEPQMIKDELQELLQDCLRIIKDLKLQYRIVDLCTGDMGDKYARCYDIEVYAPGVQRWLEVSSVGHFSDYQARRAGIRYIDAEGHKNIACTMNGSGMATPRIIAAIIETYQQADGSVIVPDVLRPFMGCDKIK